MRKLLVIDDNLDFLVFLTSALEKYFEVYTATGVKDALRLLEHRKVEAICSDYNMQDGTGLDLLEEIRQKGITVPFLLMSGDDDFLIEQQTKFYGGVFCCKTDYDLIAKIKALINRFEQEDNDYRD